MGYVLQKERNSQDILLIKPKYADDIAYVTNDENTYQQIQQETPSLLAAGALKINHSKTELYEIPKPPPPQPTPTYEELLAHRDDKICWSASEL